LVQVAFARVMAASGRVATGTRSISEHFEGLTGRKNNFGGKRILPVQLPVKIVASGAKF
jgi:hypothetical protein